MLILIIEKSKFLLNRFSRKFSLRKKTNKTILFVFFSRKYCVEIISPFYQFSPFLYPLLQVDVMDFFLTRRDSHYYF